MAEAYVSLCHHQMHHHQYNRFLEAPPEGRRAAAVDLTEDDISTIMAEAVNISGGEVARTDYGMYSDVILTGYIYDPNAVVAKVSKAHVSSPRVVEKEDEVVSP
ncbi:hypothetical protein TorRG33x02_171750 [Trema orientale]|uniref:Uncharacterized protein n=1 Tax=Trema orientale TaxID=63057 RepID=A0A2P5ENI5_TREOI|nr:hypothetical protein TorRG33x02_171750 [Trema orientale]